MWLVLPSSIPPARDRGDPHMSAARRITLPMVISREPSPISESLRKGSTWSKVPLSATSSAWQAASGCKWKEQSSPSIFNTLKRSEREGSMVRLCYQWTFPPETFGHRTSLNFFLLCKVLECSLNYSESD